MNDRRPAPPSKPADDVTRVTTPAPGAVFNPYRLFRGAHVPMAVLSCPDLSPGAKLCYGLMKDMAGRQGYCWPALRSLASKLGVSREQSKRYVHELVEQQFVASDPTLGSSNRYVFLWHATFADPSPEGGVISAPPPRVRFDPPGGVISAPQTPKGELHQLNSGSSSSPEQLPHKVLNGELDREKKRRRTATTTQTENTAQPRASDYADSREYLRALFLSSTGKPIETKLDRFIRETLELRGQDLAMFLEDIQPRLLRLSQRAGPGFWYRQAREFNSFTTRPLAPAPPANNSEQPPATEKCGHCHCTRGKGMVIENGQVVACPVCAGGPSPPQTPDRGGTVTT
jgi:hypothetical protein